MARKTTENGVRRRKAGSVQSPVVSATFGPGGNGGSVGMDDEIRRRAYEIYLERGATPGSENEDWLVAEREIRARHTNLGQAV